MLGLLGLRWRVWRHIRAQRRVDRKWLASGPSMEAIMHENNRRRTEYARWQTRGDR